MATRFERLLKAGLRIRPNETRRTAIMAAYAANAIGAVVVGRSVRDALYLTHRPASGLAFMYVLSSAVIVTVSFGYARYADKVPRGILNAASAIACAFLCIVSWFLLGRDVGQWIYPALYIFVEAMGSLIVIQFWTMANDVFHAREAKRLFGLIGGGGTLANVIFGFLVARYAKLIGASNLLWLMVLQLGFCAGLAYAAAKLVQPAPLMTRRSSGPTRTGGPSLTRAGILSIFANKHLTIVAGIAAVSAAAVTIVDFQFKIAAAASMNQNELAGYFGRFYGICGGIALGIQLWVTGRVLERYGILASLLPLPVGLAVGSTISAGLPAPGLFVQSLAKGSDTIFRYTINDASMQLLYVPVPPYIRGRAKAFIDGILKPSAIALCGLSLLFYKQMGGTGSALTGMVLLGVTLWVLLLVRARTEYVKSLVESLERRHLDLSASPLAAHNAATLAALRAALKSDSATALHALNLVQYAPAGEFTGELRTLLKSDDAAIRAATLDRLAAFKTAECLEDMRRLLEDPAPLVRAAALGAVCAIEEDNSVQTVLPFLDKVRAPEAVVRAAAAVALIRHAGLDGVLAAAEPLKQLLAAEDPADRGAAADALGNIGVRGFYRPLLSFLKDPDPGVRRRAIAAAGKLKTPELIPSLVDAFLARQTGLEAASALAAFGPGIEPQLSAVLSNESAPLECRRGVALVLGRIGTSEAAEALVDVLQSKLSVVRKAAARALARLMRRQQNVTFDHSKVQAAVHAELAGARLSLAALKKLALPLPEPNKAPRTLSELLGLSLLEERDARVLQTLLLLEVILPKIRLDVVAENLRSESASARGNAIEVLDNALPEPWKRLVLAALDEVKRRSDMVLADPRSLVDLISALISGESGLWVSACSTRWMLDEPKLVAAQFEPALVKALLSPSPPVREAAAVALHRIRPAPEQLSVLLAPLEGDPSSTVRRAARALLEQLAALPRAPATVAS